MSLVTDIEQAIKDEGIAMVVIDGLENAEVVEDEITGTSRWSVEHTAVFKRDTDGVVEYAGVDYREPATELQDWSDFEHEVYEVTPEVVTITVTKYQRKV